ncbi:glycine--tRNA ligase, chloroplastic/mitochondrial 2 isoform X1 [Cryptomeria japonica]|uniref:glycine--tRNA ligase, chloroplastic/mitochondrial 2 isoform X1 n=2 Tax=Cryptomeria japonica TaxID=3369 RepID=UPI0027DAA8BB|nr:glycine--tRNA ligase, chloroplastic/mitochondrial 2 isoform X1 [Cryptomeria japonica]
MALSSLTLSLPLAGLQNITRSAAFFHITRSENGHNFTSQTFTRKLILKPIKAQALQTRSESNAISRRIETGTFVPTFQQAIQLLQDYWASVGCAVMQCSNTEVGAGTMNPATFLRVLGPEPWNVAYVEPSIRPDDSRYGDNPNRLQRHTQFQVILKPDPGNSQDLYISSLVALGIDIKAHDIRFVEDNWESPVLGAWGLGWEVWMDGMEITQFTYFQQAGSLQLMPVSVEITYGLERILMSLQGVDHFKNIQYAPGITYGELFLENEKEMSAYNLEFANVEQVQQHFELFDSEARSLLSKGLAIPAYDHVLKTSHAFNILDARGSIGVTERARFFSRMRSLARQCAQLWVKTRELLGYPLGIWEEKEVLCYPQEAIDKLVEKIKGKQTFVLEVGTEELPSQDVTEAIEQLQRAITILLEKRRLHHGDVSVSGTPRRLVVHVQSLAPKQDEIEIEVRGPPVGKAYDLEGKPTKAIEGFCRKNGASISDLFRKSEGKTEYVYARLKEPTRHAIQVLAEDIPAILSGLSFPKSMQWNTKTYFSRPIRWILALHGDVVVPFTYAGILSGRLSHGLRMSSSPIIEVPCAEDYMSSIMDAGIVLNVEERRKNISQSCSALAQIIGGKVILETALLGEVANLVENPLPILGAFDEHFLELPSDVLITVMRKHQRYFPIVDASNGKLLPAFIAVANGQVDEATVQKGNEAVLRARYEDAKFFYRLDTTKHLMDFREQLKGILFQEKLGSMLDKSKRIEKMISRLGAAMGLEENKFSVAQSAAELTMSDLATTMVMEFTSLAGIMGRHYALREGYSQEVADAIFERVLPRFAGDELPETDVGILLAVADRLDSLVGLFAVGCQPSATSDPFGLRRISYGLVQILVENQKNVDLTLAIQIAADSQPLHVSPSVIADVHLFLTRRLEQLLQVDQSISVEIVRSILSERANMPCLAAISALQMENLFKDDIFKLVVEAYSRPTKIIQGKNVHSAFQVDEALFETEEEKALWSAFQNAQSRISPSVEIDVFIEASVQLVQPLEHFFSNVFVMTEDEKLRNNRLALLGRIANLPRGIADLSVLPGF